MAELKPLAGYVLIEPFDEEETTAEGLIIPEKAKEKPSKGKVIAVGGSLKHYYGGVIQFEESPVAVDSIVQYHRWSGQDIKENQKEYRLVKFGDLMAVYE